MSPSWELWLRITSSSASRLGGGRWSVEWSLPQSRLLRRETCARCGCRLVTAAGCTAVLHTVWTSWAACSLPHCHPPPSPGPAPWRLSCVRSTAMPATVIEGLPAPSPTAWGSSTSTEPSRCPTTGQLSAWPGAPLVSVSTGRPACTPMVHFSWGPSRPWTYSPVLAGSRTARGSNINSGDNLS